MIAAIYVRKSTEQNRKRIGRTAAMAAVFLVSFCAPAFGQVGRYQVTPNAGGTILLDTATGCTWQLYEDPTIKRAYFGIVPRMGVGPGRSELRPLTSRECLTITDGVMEETWQKKYEKGDR
jgi:hypothetical protein